MNSVVVAGIGVVAVLAFVFSIGGQTQDVYTHTTVVNNVSMNQTTGNFTVNGNLTVDGANFGKYNATHWRIGG